MILGLCGLARCGKDSFFEFTKEYYKMHDIECKRFAFADELKKEIDDSLKLKFNISAFTHSAKEKDIIRPELVKHGMKKRKSSKGNYWIKKIEDKVLKFSDPRKMAIVTDVRFENEVDWINDVGGTSIHITRIGNNPPNSEEKENDPKVKSKALHKFTWIDFGEEFHSVGKIAAYNILDSL